MRTDHWPLWQDFFRCLITAAANADLYQNNHPQVLHLCTQAHAILERLLSSDQNVELLLMEEDIVIGNKPLPATLHTSRFAGIMRARGIEYLRIFPGISEQELVALVVALSRRGQSGSTLPTSAHLVFGILDLEEGAAGLSSAGPCGDIREFSGADRTLKEVARFAEICESARKHRQVSIVGLSEIVSRFMRSLEGELPPLHSMAPLREMDEYTFTHATNVCLLNLAQGKSLGLEPALLHDIGLAGLLHDIGKLFVPEEILRKPGKPTDEEWEILRRHPAKGAAYLLETSGVPHLCVIAAFEHHIKYNQSGYPKVPSGWRQHLASHITTISDVFDAICTKRSYRNPNEVREAVGIVQNLAGTDFHPQLAENFLGVINTRLPEGGRNWSGQGGTTE